MIVYGVIEIKAFYIIENHINHVFASPRKAKVELPGGVKFSCCLLNDDISLKASRSTLRTIRSSESLGNESVNKRRLRVVRSESDDVMGSQCKDTRVSTLILENSELPIPSTRALADCSKEIATFPYVEEGWPQGKMKMSRNMSFFRRAGLNRFFIVNDYVVLLSCRIISFLHCVELSGSAIVQDFIFPPLLMIILFLHRAGRRHSAILQNYILPPLCKIIWFRHRIGLYLHAILQDFIVRPLSRSISFLYRTQLLRSEIVQDFIVWLLYRIILFFQQVA